MTAHELCPARRTVDKEGGVTLCSPEAKTEKARGMWGFICRRCFEAMLRGAADREAVRQEWELEA